VLRLENAHRDRLSALVDAAALRADDLAALFDFVVAIADLWERLGLRDPLVDAQLGDAQSRADLARASRERDVTDGQERERLAFYALRTLAALQTVVDAWRRRPATRTTLINR
jgi:hypothetical protein